MSTTRTCGAAETRASHEVMELVRGSAVLSHMVVQLRATGMSWRHVRAAIQAEIGRRKCPSGAETVSPTAVVIGMRGRPPGSGAAAAKSRKGTVRSTRANVGRRPTSPP